MKRSYILMRVDGGARVGIGHIMRCLALAQALKTKNHEPIFITRPTAKPLLKRLTDDGFKYLFLKEDASVEDDAAEVVRIAKNIDADWVVTDGYQFHTEYQRSIKSAGFSLCCIDDIAKYYFVSDVVLNQNLGAEYCFSYSHEPYCRLLLGNKYVMLRREFLDFKKQQRTFSRTASRILVTLGGSDPNNQTLKVLQALKRLKGFSSDVKVVVGGTNPNIASLEIYLKELPFDAKLFKDVNNISSLMMWADIAISAGGSTCWEMAYLGLPNIILVLAENQIPVAEQLEKKGVSINLGWWEDVKEENIVDCLSILINNSERREKMSLIGRQLVDGYGTQRVVACLEDFKNSRYSDKR